MFAWPRDERSARSGTLLRRRSRSTEPNRLPKLLETVNINLGEREIECVWCLRGGHAASILENELSDTQEGPAPARQPAARDTPGSRASDLADRGRVSTGHVLRHAGRFGAPLRQRVRISFCRPRRPHPPPWHDASVATTGPRLRTAARARAQHAHGARALAGL
jgi:hypothetical protein